MTGLTPFTRRLIALALLIAAFALPYNLLVRPLVDSYAASRQDIADQEELLARYRSLAAAGAPLRAQFEQLRRDVESEAAYLSGESEALVAAQLQNRVKTMIGSAGGKLASTQVLQSTEDGGLRQVTIRVRMTTDITGLREIVHSLETERPYLFLDNMDISAREASRARPENAGDAELTVTFDIYGFMRQKSV